MNFKELGIREEVCDALIGMDITEPTEIQAKVMPDIIKGADIIVGTPGRLLDHLARGSLKLSGIKVLVLDECDKMVSMGFIDDVDKILKATPKNRQTLLFGATVSHEIAKIRDRY